MSPQHAAPFKIRSFQMEQFIEVFGQLGLHSASQAQRPGRPLPFTDTRQSRHVRRWSEAEDLRQALEVAKGF
jgi:hypothetical protein